MSTSPIWRWPLSIAGLCGAVSLGLGAPASAQDVSAPQGYISMNYSLPKPSRMIEYSIRFDEVDASPRGTFWANMFRFSHSQHSSRYPARYSGGAQGGYVGAQLQPDGRTNVIFSIWWADDFRAADSAISPHCLSATEMWYTDDRQPKWIHSLDAVDPRRQSAGGPFVSCRADMPIRPGVDYRFRLDGTGGGSWWKASVVDGASGRSYAIGDIRVPREWGGIESSSGFIEHFAPMPAGCASIPASKARISAPRSLSPAMATKVDLTIYGACRDEVTRRYSEYCAPDGSWCSLTVHPTQAIRANESAQTPPSGWRFEPVAGQSGLFRIRGANGYLNIEQGAPIFGAIQPGWWSAMWRVENVGGERYRLRNFWKPDLMLARRGGKLITEQVSNSGGQLWLLPGG